MSLSIRSTIASMLVLCAACGAEEQDPAQSQHHLEAHSFDGEALYRGIILAHGPVASVVPEIRDHLALARVVAAPERRTRLLRAYDQLAAAIREDDPEFFSWFHEQLSSGDHFTIAAALETAREKTQEALTQVSGVALQGRAPGNVGSDEPPELPPSVPPHEGLWWAVAALAYVWVAIHNMVLVTALGYVLAATEVVTSDVASQGSLLNDMLVHSIVVHLSPHLQASLY